MNQIDIPFEKEMLAVNVLKAIEKDLENKKAFQDQLDNTIQIILYRKEKIEMLINGGA
jgi:hypothetical protein